MRLHLLRIVVLLTMCGLPSVSYAQSGARGISDFVVAFDDITNESTIYVTDEVSHAIYKIKGAHADLRAPKETPLAALDLFFKHPELQAPTGIAYYNGKLLVCDKASDAVFEIDTTTRIMNLLFEKGAITKPTQVAVSQNGRVAITNAAGDIVLYQRVTRNLSGKRRIENKRIAFAGDDLLILNGAGQLSLIQGKTFDSALSSKRLELSGAPGDSQQIVDIGFVNGIYYLAAEGQVYAHVRTENATLPLFNQPLPSSSLNGISVNKQLVALRNSRNQSIIQFARPVAMTAGFDEHSAPAVIPFYEYLLNQGALPTTTFSASRDYKSAGELLREKKVVFPAVADDLALNLFCRLNKDICPARWEETKSIPIKKGEKLTLPALNYSEVIGYNTRILNNESVNDYLTKTFSSTPKLKDRFTADFLWSLNELSKAETLEFQLQTKLPGAVIAAPPRKNLEPGGVIKFGTDLDALAGTVTKCGIQVKSSTRPFNLAKLMFGTVKGPDAFRQLPRTSASAMFTKRLQQKGITEVQYELDNAVVEQGDQKAVNAALSASAVTGATPVAATEPTAQPSPAPDQKTCLANLVGPSNYFIVDAVKVNVGRYKVLQNGSLVRFTAEEMSRLGLLGEPGEGNYSFEVKTPFYVAYRLSPWTNETVFQNPTTTPITNTGSIKLRGSQDILNLKNGELLLPYVMQWQFTFLLNEKELSDEGSEFNKLKSSHKFKTLSAEETSRSATASREVDQVPEDPPPLEMLTTLREMLKREISLPADYQHVDVPIGIGEHPCTVDKNHPDFKNQDGTNAWIKDPIAAASSTCNAATDSGKRVKTFSEVGDSDHGTHVAGIIGARANTTAPGLLPAARLFLVDASSASNLFSSIENAVKRDVFIFNFSFGDLDNDQDLQDGISVAWAKRLFVVAVDNEGADLTTSRKPPVLWMDHIKSNMIGVGSSVAAGGSHYVLGDWLTPRGFALGSSYGKSYVHLVAPGYSIYSTIPGNAYGPQTGASFAAPQVTAAAALLFNADIKDPAEIKARLIYTSDWFEQLRGKVWGGFLNVRRSVWEPKRNLLVTEFASDTTDAIKLDPNNIQQLTIKKGIQYDLAGPDATLKKEIQVPFHNVLRLTRRHKLLYRVIYLDSERRVRIVLNAEISGIVPCLSVEQWNGQAFTPSNCGKYTGNLDASRLLEYVATTPSDIKF